MNMISFIYYFNLLISSYVGTIIIYLSPGEYFNRLISQITDSNTRIFVWLAVSYTLIAFPIGVLLSKKIFAVISARKLLQSYIDKPVLTLFSKRDSYIKYPLYAFGIISVMVAIITLSNIDYSTLYGYLANGTQIELLRFRTEVSRSIIGNTYIRNIFAVTLLPLLSYIFYIYYRNSNSRLDYIWFLVFFIASISMKVYDLQKIPIFLYLLGFYVINISLGKKYNSKQLFNRISIGTLLMVGIYLMLVKNIDISYMTSIYREGLVGRIFISEISSLYSHFEYFPIEHEHIGNTSLSNVVSNIFDLPHSARSARIILLAYASSWIENGYGGVFNTLFIGEAYANYGAIGVILSPLYVGAIIGGFYYTLLRLPKHPLFLALMAHYTINSSVSAGINDYIWNPRIFILMGVIFIIIYQGSSLRR
jgi:hypothetical protein